MKIPTTTRVERRGVWCVRCGMFDHKGISESHTHSDYVPGVGLVSRLSSVDRCRDCWLRTVGKPAPTTRGEDATGELFGKT